MICNVALLLTPKVSLILGHKLSIHKKGHITRTSTGFKDVKKPY